MSKDHVALTQPAGPKYTGPQCTGPGSTVPI